MVESVTRDFVRRLKAAVATARNQTSDGCTQHIVASATITLQRSEPQTRELEPAHKCQRVNTRPDSPRVVTSSRRNETLAVLARAPR